jgi:hypothetical protein
MPVFRYRGAWFRNTDLQSVRPSECYSDGDGGGYRN